MTTIAIRGGVVAADSQVTADGLRAGSTAKIIKRGQAVAGFTGKCIGGQAFLDWFSSGMQGDAPLELMDGTTGVIVSPGNPLLIAHEEGWERRWVDCEGFGSGGDIALGAMLAGATVEEAVRLACTRDTRSGGPITVLTTG